MGLAEWVGTRSIEEEWKEVQRNPDPESKLCCSCKLLVSILGTALGVTSLSCFSVSHGSLPDCTLPASYLHLNFNSSLSALMSWTPCYACCTLPSGDLINLGLDCQRLYTCNRGQSCLPPGMYFPSRRMKKSSYWAHKVTITSVLSELLTMS